MNGNDADRMSLIDDLMLDEIFADDVEEEVGALEALLKSLDGAELALRKSRLAVIRAQIDSERRNPIAVHVDAERMRAKLRAAANDPDVKMTLAARNAVEGVDDEEEGLLEDLAELERDRTSEQE